LLLRGLRGLLAAVLAVALLTQPAEARRRRAPPCVPPSDARELLIRTVWGEAHNQPQVGRIAVAAVILNRLKTGRYGGSVRAVVLAPKQFEPWMRRRCQLVRLTPRSPGWGEAARAVDAALAGEDPTAAGIGPALSANDPREPGASHFANEATVRQRRNARALAWLARLKGVQRIGAHTFGFDPAFEGSFGSPFHLRDPS
jgi:spore germination cell wall hydrolase CwlJ-like protein